MFEMFKKLLFIFFIASIFISCEKKTSLYLSDYIAADNDLERIAFEKKLNFYNSLRNDVLLFLSSTYQKESGSAKSSVDPDLKVTISALGTVALEKEKTPTSTELSSPAEKLVLNDSSNALSLQNKESLPKSATTRENLSFEKSILAKTLFNRFDFRGSIESFDKEHSYDALYYRGMSYYQLMSNESYTKEERRGFRIKAIEDLKQVSEGYQSDDEKRALATFWYAVASHLESPNYSKTVTALKKITEDASLIRTKRYNDSLYLMGVLSAKRSPEAAKDCIKKLSEITHDDNIWDVNSKKYITNKEAVKKIQEMIRSS